MKTIALMPRRPDTSRAAFREHYETRHVPLALRYFRFAKYVRNHLVDPKSDGIGFDSISEFWHSDLSEAMRLMGSAVGDIMREDERRFTDQPRIRPATSEEILLAGPPRGVDEGIHRKEALLLARPAGIDKNAFIDDVKRWGQEIARRAGKSLLRLTLDVATPFEGIVMPCEAVLTAWLAEPTPVLAGAVAPNGIDIWCAVQLESSETSAERLRAGPTEKL